MAQPDLSGSSSGDRSGLTEQLGRGLGGFEVVLLR
jgi:hypothetical protein